MDEKFISYYILLMLLIIPGFLCRSIYARLNVGLKQEDGLRLIITSLIFSVWILALNYVILCIFYNLRTIPKILFRLNEVSFIFQYIGMTLASCFIIAILMDFLRPVAIKFLNFIREAQGKSLLTINDTIWDDVVADVNNRAVIVLKNSHEVIRGVVESTSYTSNGEKELYILNHPRMIGNIPENAIKGVYMDYKNDLLIKIVNPEWLSQKQSDHLQEKE